MQHIVLDLDECLVHVYSDKVDWRLYNTLQKPEHYPRRSDVFLVQLPKDRMWGVKRPHLDNFLAYCFQHFQTVSVWSAGTAEYVHAVVEQIFRDWPQPKLILTRNHVLYEEQEENDRFYCKPLQVFFKHMPEANRTNTLLVDNQFSNSKYDPENIIHVPDFLPKQSLEGIYANDDCFTTLIAWFKEKKKTVNDVRDLDKRNIFVPAHERLMRSYLLSLSKLPITWPRNWLRIQNEI